ncbi:hypothetical protein [Pseudomonas putida]|jgi:hypothetical protein|uniref:hypothetical protein n=1 Tax=Pseudomonas TaxID=286 RepID=UPI0021F861CB|nr:hypothetical protein [Pseudomonas putida]
MLESQKAFATYLKKMQGLHEGQMVTFDQTLLPKVMTTERMVPVIAAVIPRSHPSRSLSAKDHSSAPSRPTKVKQQSY